MSKSKSSYKFLSLLLSFLCIFSSTCSNLVFASEKHELTIEDCTNGNAYISGTEKLTEYYNEGNVVSLDLISQDETYNCAVCEIYDPTGEHIYLDEPDIVELENGKGKVIFTMPNEDLTVKINFLIDKSKSAKSDSDDKDIENKDISNTENNKEDSLKNDIIFEVESNSNKEVISENTSATEDSLLNIPIQTKTINPAISLSSQTYNDEDFSNNLIESSENQKIIDKITYSGLEKNKNYVFVCQLVDVETGALITDDDNKPISTSKFLKRAHESGTIDVEFPIDTTKLAGKTISFIEYLFFGDEAGSIEDEDYVAKHTDYTDTDQYIHVIEASLNAISEETSFNVTTPTETNIDISVSCNNIIPNEEYTVKSVLVSGDTKEVIKDSNVSETITPEDDNFSLQLKTKFDASAFEGKSVFVNTEIYYKDVLLYKNIESNEIKVSHILSEISDNATSDKIGSKAVITSNIEYSNLIPNLNYTIYGAYIDTDKINVSEIKENLDSYIPIRLLKDESGNEFYKINKNRFETETGYFVYDNSLKLYVECDENGMIIEDSEKTLTYEEILNLLNLKFDYDESLFHLFEYKFNPTSEKGTETLTIDISDKHINSGDTYTFIPFIFLNDTLIAFETDFQNETNSIYYPILTSELKDTNTETDTGIVSNKELSSMLTDTISLSNLVVGKEYTIKGALINTETGDLFVNKNKKEILSEKSFVAKNDTMTIDLVYEYLSTENTSITTQNQLYYNDILVFDDSVEDNDVEWYPCLTSEAVDETTNVHQGVLGKTKIVDTVSYNNLVVGQEYTIHGILMDADDKVVLGSDDTVKGNIKDYTGKENYYTASTTFTPEEKSGTVTLTFEYEVKTGKVISVFEDLTVNDKTVYTHENWDNELQKIYYPDLSGVVLDSGTAHHVASKSSTAKLKDTITYKNLLKNSDYLITGYLMDKETGEKIDNTDTVTKLTTTDKNTSGSITLEFALDTTKYAGKTIVACETLVYKAPYVKDGNKLTKDITIFEQKDKDDKTRSIYCPSLSNALSVNQTVITDVIKYSNLEEKQSYTIKGYLTDENGKSIGAAVSKTFTATETSGEVTLSYSVPSNYIGKTVIVKEELYCNSKLVADNSGNTSTSAVVVKSTTDNSGKGDGPQTDDVAKGIMIFLINGLSASLLIFRKKIFLK